MGLTRQPWRSAAPVRKVFRDAFAAVGLPHANTHSYRKTFVRLGQGLRLTPEEWKAWSRNLRHESETTTFVGYGAVPSRRQGEIMAALANPRSTRLPARHQRAGSPSRPAPRRQTDPDPLAVKRYVRS